MTLRSPIARLTVLGAVAVALLASPHAGAANFLNIWYYPSYNTLRVRIRPDQVLRPIEASRLHTPDGQPGMKGEYWDFRPEVFVPPEPDDDGEMDGEARENAFETLAEPDANANADLLALTHLDDSPDFVRVDPEVNLYWWGLLGSPITDPQNDFAARWTGKVGPFDEALELAVIARHGIRLWVDGEAKVDAWGLRESDFVTDFSGVIMQPGRQYDVRLEYLKGDGRGWCRLGYRLPAERAAAVKSVRIELLNAAGESLYTQTLNWDGGDYSTELQIPDLPAGSYRVVAHIPEVQAPAEARFRRERFAWENSRMGVTDVIYPPFAPLQVEGRRIDMVLRRYTLGGLGMFASVEARGQEQDTAYRELLARPIALVVDGADTLEGSGDFTAVTPQAVTYRGSASHPGVQVETTTTTEYDGCMRVELTLKPGAEAKEIQSLTLDIPIKDAEAPLTHIVRGSRPLRFNRSRAVWEGEGMIYDSTQFRDNRWPSSFRPYWWFGSEARGIAWFADNEKGWILSPDAYNDTGRGVERAQAPCQTLWRQDGVLTLRIHFIQTPTVLTEPRTIVFGLQASPTKPMPTDWRMVARQGGEPGWNFSMPTLFGMPSNYRARRPIGGDWSTFAHMQFRRLGAGGDPEYVTDVLSRRIDPLEVTGYRGRVLTGLDRYERSNRSMNMYFDEFISASIMEEETWIYVSEWGSQAITNDQRPPAFRTPYIYDWGLGAPGITASYRDYATWCAAEWLRRGVGLYFDNSFVKQSLDTISSEAFVREDGTIVPSCGIWNHRDYLKRIWVLHQQFRNPKSPSIMMIHMTNTQILPMHTWNEVNLDLEWRLREEIIFQERYTPELLRAESIGLQTGNIPVLMAGATKINPDWYNLYADRFERVRKAGILVHDTIGGINAERYPKPAHDFGMGLPDTQMQRYWEPNPIVVASDPQAKWLLLRRGDSALLVICTWNPQDSDVTFTLDTRRLGFVPLSVTDAEDGSDAKGRLLVGEKTMPDTPAEPDADAEADLLDEAVTGVKLTLDVPKGLADSWIWDENAGSLTLPLPGLGVRYVHLSTVAPAPKAAPKPKRKRN